MMIMEMKKSKADHVPKKVWDTSGIINSMLIPEGYTVQEVLDELKDHNSLRTFDLQVEMPNELLFKKIVSIEKELNERISLTDKKVLALALEKRAKLMTDDNGIQNIASFLGVETEGNFFNIKKPIMYGFFCTACKKESRRVCENCGNAAKRIKQ